MVVDIDVGMVLVFVHIACPTAQKILITSARFCAQRRKY
jgi:hypothetical protein